MHSGPICGSLTRGSSPLSTDPSSPAGDLDLEPDVTISGHHLPSSRGFLRVLPALCPLAYLTPLSVSCSNLLKPAQTCHLSYAATLEALPSWKWVQQLEQDDMPWPLVTSCISRPCPPSFKWFCLQLSTAIVQSKVV